MKRKLSVIRGLQKKYPYLHVGGSMGIFLHGIDLKRPISDIDMCIHDENFDKTNADENPGRFSGHDFDYCFQMSGFKIELKIDSEQKFKIILYNGDSYRVTELKTILEYKKKYADRGYEKHIKDLQNIYSQVKTRTNGSN